MQVYLPQDLYEQVKSRRIKVSELLQDVLRREVRRLEKIEAAERHLAERIAEVGAPSEEDRAWAEQVAGPVVEHLRRTGRR